MTIPVQIYGVGVTHRYSLEYTTNEVRADFENALKAIIAVGSSSSAANPPTSASLTAFNDAYNKLKQMALTIDPATGIPSITSAMAKAVNSLVSLVSAINPNSNGLSSTQQLAMWSDLYYSGIESSLAAFVNVTDGSNRSLQSFIELEYISHGNQLLYDQMADLNSAMVATNQALTVLSKVQNLLNKAVIVAPTKYTSRNWAQSGFPARRQTIGARSAPGKYRDSISQSLGQPLLIQVSPGFASDIQSEGISLISQMKDLIITLNQLNPSGALDPTSLQAKLQTVINDMSSPTFGALSVVAWALDNDNHGPGSNPALAGTYQRNVTNAISTAQTVNTSQNTTLQTLLFNFQEFYTSASSLLRTINRLITQMTSKMA